MNQGKQRMVRLRRKARSSRCALRPLLEGNLNEVWPRPWDCFRIGSATMFMLTDGIMKLFKPSLVVEANARLGYPDSILVGIGVALLVCTALYVVPRTSILGAILRTGYPGGAVASVLVWSGLWLRENHLHNLLPLVTSNPW
jgi:hypothetical protein